MRVLDQAPGEEARVRVVLPEDTQTLGLWIHEAAAASPDSDVADAERRFRANLSWI